MRHCKYQVNHSFFHEISTPSQAYVLGFVFADGNVSLRKDKNQGGGNCLQIFLQTRDEQILCDIAREMESSHPVFRNKNNSCGLVITSDGICRDLITLGCTPRKSLTLQWPSIDKSLERHFLRGLFDGDGSVWSQTVGRHLHPQFMASLCGTMDICERAAGLICGSLEWNLIPVKPNGSIFRISFGGNKKIRTFAEWLYTDASIFLRRKRDRFDEVFKIVPYSKK